MARRLQIKLRGDRTIWLLVVIFAMCSLVFIYSATSRLGTRFGVSNSSFMFNQLLWFCVGFGGMLICYKIPLRWWRKMTYPLLGFSALLLILAAVTRDPRHITFGGHSLPLQPSELAKVATVLYLARALEVSKLATFREYFIRILGPVGGIVVLAALGSSSAAIIITVISGVILVFAKVRWNYLGYTALIGLGAVAMMFGISYATDGKVFSRIPTLTARVERFFVKDKEGMSEQELEEYQAKTEQKTHAREAIQLGGWFGRGPSNSLKKYVLPNAYDDYAFATIAEEYGLFGCSLLMVLYIVFFYRCLNIAKECTRPFATITTLGLGFLVIFQAFVHIMVNIGLIPETGQTLPLISNGGSSIVVLSCAVGIILSINRTLEITEEKEAENERILAEKMRQEEERMRQDLHKMG